MARFISLPTSGPSTAVKPLTAMRRMPMSSVETWWTSSTYSLSVKTRPTWANRVTAMTSAAPENAEDVNRQQRRGRQDEASVIHCRPSVEASSACRMTGSATETPTTGR
ncbi:hypothetical protein AB5J52_01645 [Streptomyces sp. R39]|uniref:Uncharacterized protein n=1 Tax=Streptomyces sp. R39 TaxID=3238631 RepID=A0AB39QJB5_9ACTN